jgi:hypothetical protein
MFEGKIVFHFFIIKSDIVKHYLLLVITDDFMFN